LGLLFGNDDKNTRKYPISWDQIELMPTIELKSGILRKTHPLTSINTGKRDRLLYVNNFVELKGKWDNTPEFGSHLTLKLKNISDSSIRLTRLIFPAENGLDSFMTDFRTKNISFFRNGHQSWSTARSYSLKDKPIRPWLRLVSLASSNLSNLPSNTNGLFSSEMYAVIKDSTKENSFFIGQTPPFNQFFYIKLNLFFNGVKRSHFELIYDFGRKYIEPGESIQLSGIIMALGNTNNILNSYFNYIHSVMQVKILEQPITGWSSWYYYYTKIKPEDIIANTDLIKQRNMQIKLVQLDDGYQKGVGDWLERTPEFRDKMKYIADKITDDGFTPGIWLAPFIADKKSDLVKYHPEYILRNEYGKPIVAGYNPSWPGKYYYGLDITNPRFQEYLRKVIRTMVHIWGFKYLKLDFLFGGCLRGGTHHDLRLSRAEVLKLGLQIIREEAGEDVILVGCGCPLTPAIGLVDIMRVGPDTSDQWNKIVGHFLQTGAMISTRNSIRNFMVRSFMNKKLWVNDPDCMMVRKTSTKLSKYERRSQINAIILAGGTLSFSDNFFKLQTDILLDIDKIIEIHADCFKGEAIPIDLMNSELPEIFYNSSGYLGVFNFHNKRKTISFDLNKVDAIKKDSILTDVWKNEQIELNAGILTIKNMPKHSSKLIKIKNL